MRAALRMPVQQLSHSAMLEYLSSALAGAIASSGYPSDPIMTANAAMLSDPTRPLGYGMAGLGLPTGLAAWQGFGDIPPLHDPPSMHGIPPLHVSHAAGLASVASMRPQRSSLRPAGSGTKVSRPRNKTPRKRGEVPNPGVNGSLGGATPAAIQAEGGFQCPLCDRVYKSESGLRLHRRTVHEGFKGYPCPHCNKLFTQKSHVKTHVRAVHEGKRDYNCPVCTKLFTRASNRDRHVRTVHRNASIHPCDMCERVFISESDLRDHKVAHHTGGSSLAVALLCPQCHAPFHSRAVLNHHVHTAHGGEPTAPGTRVGRFIELEDSLEQPSEAMPPPPDGGAYSAAMASYASGGPTGAVYAATGGPYALPSTAGTAPGTIHDGEDASSLAASAAMNHTLGANAAF
jgi:rubredoxin